MDDPRHADMVTREARRSCGDGGPTFHWIAPAVVTSSPEWAEHYAEQTLLHKRVISLAEWFHAERWLRQQGERS